MMSLENLKNFARLQSLKKSLDLSFNTNLYQKGTTKDWNKKSTKIIELQNRASADLNMQRNLL